MADETQPWATERKTNGTGQDNTRTQKEPAQMGKQDRKALVLQYLVHTRLALPPAVLYRNLRLRQNATFSESTLKNYLDELEAEGLIKRVDPEAMVEREAVAVENGRGYWMATERGRQACDDSFSFM